MLEGKPVQIRDVLSDPDYTYLQSQKKGGFRTILGAPLLRESTPIGVLLLARKDVRPFTQNHIDLIDTFANQAVIAIETVRLSTTFGSARTIFRNRSSNKQRPRMC